MSGFACSSTKAGRIAGFTQQYRVHRLVYFESFPCVRSAVAREKYDPAKIDHTTEYRLKAPGPEEPARIKFRPSQMQKFGGSKDNQRE
jgi:hypothetical protein